MAKIGRPSVEEHRQRVEIIAGWKATPEELRKAKNLKELALQNGCLPNSHWYEIAASAEVAHEVLVRVAGENIERAKAIMDRLYAWAMDPDPKISLKAMPILLEWVRKVITDSSLLSKLKPQTDINESLEMAFDTVAKIGKIIKFLGDNQEEAEKKLRLLNAKEIPYEDQSARPDLLPGESGEPEDGGEFLSESPL